MRVRQDQLRLGLWRLCREHSAVATRRSKEARRYVVAKECKGTGVRGFS